MFLIGNPLGKLVLIVAAIGLAAYSLWGFTRAIYDPLHRGSDASGYMARLGFVTSALSYAAIVFFALQLLAGSGASTADGTQKTVAAVLTHPAGGALTILIGLIVIGSCPGSVSGSLSRHLRARPERRGDEHPHQGHRGEARPVRDGRPGRDLPDHRLVVVQAGIHHDPAQAQGFSGAFVFLLAQPFGRILLGIVALGFVALGLHSLNLRAGCG